MSTTTRGYGTEGAAGGVTEPAVLVGSTTKKSSLTTSVMPYALTLVAGIVIGLIAVYATGSVKVGEGSQKVGNYFSVVEPGMTAEENSAEKAAEAIKMSADNIAPKCLVQCQEDFPLFSTAATAVVFDCHYFQVDWWMDPEGGKAMECMRAKCTEQEQAKFRKAFECNCAKGACEFDEPYQAITPMDN